MIGWLVKRKMDAYERDFDYDMGYSRDIYAASPRAFWRFARFLGMSRHREDIPLEAWYAAKLAATLGEDCGPCTQLVVTMAERDGVKPATLRAVLEGNESSMPTDAALGFRFARTVLTHDAVEGDRLRADVMKRWGRRAVVSLAFAIASSRVFPTVKYALGHGKACARVSVAGEDVATHGEDLAR